MNSNLSTYTALHFLHSLSLITTNGHIYVPASTYFRHISIKYFAGPHVLSNAATVPARHRTGIYTNLPVCDVVSHSGIMRSVSARSMKLPRICMIGMSLAKVRSRLYVRVSAKGIDRRRNGTDSGILSVGRMYQVN